MPLSRDICRYLHTVSQTNTCHFAQGRVWFFRSNCPNLCANTSFKRAIITSWPIFSFVKTTPKSRNFLFAFLLFSRFFYELVNCRHFIRSLPLAHKIMEHRTCLPAEASAQAGNM